MLLPLNIFKHIFKDIFRKIISTTLWKTNNTTAQLGRELIPASCLVAYALQQCVHQKSPHRAKLILAPHISVCTLIASSSQPSKYLLCVGMKNPSFIIQVKLCPYQTLRNHILCAINVCNDLCVTTLLSRCPKLSNQWFMYHIRRMCECVVNLRTPQEIPHWCIQFMTCHMFQKGNLVVILLKW